MECAQIIWIMYIIVLSFGFLTGERHLILGTAKKGILTLKYGSKDLLPRDGISVDFVPVYQIKYRAPHEANE